MKLTKAEAERLIANLTGITANIVSEAEPPKRTPGIHQVQINVGSKRRSGRTTMLHSMARELGKRCEVEPTTHVVFSARYNRDLPRHHTSSDGVSYISSHKSILDWVRGRTISTLNIFFDNITHRELDDIMCELATYPHLYWANINIYVSISDF